MKLILFDEYCNLCNSSIKFISKRDENKLYTFVSLQSKEGQNLLKNYKLSLTDFNTIVLIENNKSFTSSTAVLMIIKNLTGVVKYLFIFIFLPPFIRDSIYKLVSKYRYRIFGKGNKCSLDI